MVRASLSVFSASVQYHWLVMMHRAPVRLTSMAVSRGFSSVKSSWLEKGQGKISIQCMTRQSVLGIERL